MKNIDTDQKEVLFNPNVSSSNVFYKNMLVNPNTKNILSTAKKQGSFV